MLITSAHLYPLEVPMGQPIKMAGETLTHAKTLLVKLTDEQGNEGWGEASAAPLMTGETLGSIAANAEYLAARLVGVAIDDPSDIVALLDRVMYGNSSAKSCLEIAMLDLFAQRRGVPMYVVLAGKEDAAHGVELQMMHMLASGDLERELCQAHALRAQGYRHWKIKIGGGDTSLDIRRIRTLCSELQGDTISADANQALSVIQATQIAAAGAEAGLSFLEQPFMASELDAMSSLHRESGLDLCADESIHNIQDIVVHAERNAAQGVSLKAIKLGGVQAVVEAGLICLARAMHINLACKVAETTISAAATAHAGLALANVTWGFSMSNLYLAEDVCEHPLLPLNGAITASALARPGLGFVPDKGRLKKFASTQWPRCEVRA